MSALRELKPITNHHAVNAARWRELCADHTLAALSQRIEYQQPFAPRAHHHGAMDRGRELAGDLDAVLRSKLGGKWLGNLPPEAHALLRG